MESSYQPILPGLPDDLALRCLAKIPHGYHGSLETVSKRWRGVLRSGEYSSYKAKEGWSGDWVFLLTENSKNRWIAYDPDANRWHPIPLIPGREEYSRSEGFGCVCVGSRFLVIGGTYYRTFGVIEKPYITNQVFQFDTFTKEWSEAASMRTPREDFGCCVMSGKVYVCGGRNMSSVDGLALAEVYDPLTDKWEELPPMRNNLMDCLSLSHDGKLYVFSDRHCNIQPFNNIPMCEYRTEIFDASKQVWRTEQMNWPCSEVQVTEDGRMYAGVYVDGEENVVMTMDNGGEWHVVAQLPAPSMGPPPCDGYKGVCANGFVALGNELYFMAGVTYCRGATEGIIGLWKLDRCLIWDGKWRETRPFCPPSRGIVKGFAALKETKISTT